MIIGPKKLLQLVKKINLVENLDERELKNPEGAGFDFRLGEVYQIEGKAFLGKVERQTPSIKLLANYDSQKNQSFIFKPGSFYLVTTIEKVNLPLNIAATFIPRTTTFRSGLFLRTGIAQPGYCGKLTFGIKNEGPVEVEIELGARFVFAVFSWVDGGGEKYRGQWQGGRVTTEKKEVQV
jgi:deoxycytidine triphosphate deaminase